MTDTDRNYGVRKRVGLFERKFQRDRGSFTNYSWSWRQKTRVPGLSRGVVCAITTFSSFDIIPACDGQTTYT